MADTQTCLSMHQPWASLVVHGIKRIEGRDWHSTHRGTLWIHSTSKAADPSEIAEVEDFYRNIYAMEGKEIKFPQYYPAGVVLGHVTIMDVVSRDDLVTWPQLPNSVKLEALSQQCFLCENPKRLVLPQPVKGQMKLWKLPTEVWKVALMGLRDPLNQGWTWAEFRRQRIEARGGRGGRGGEVGRREGGRGEERGARRGLEEGGRSALGGGGRGGHSEGEKGREEERKGGKGGGGGGRGGGEGREGARGGEEATGDREGLVGTE